MNPSPFRPAPIIHFWDLPSGQFPAPYHYLEVTPLKPLAWPDSHHLRAAQGWLELGNYLEANDELENICALMRAHPHVLEVRWHIYAAADKWYAASEIAHTLVRLVPDNPQHWVHRSYSLHELKRTSEARDQLLVAAKTFPAEVAIPYNLACYECQLGNLVEAKTWLTKSFALADCKDLKLDALSDPDLEPLWIHIGKV